MKPARYIIQWLMIASNIVALVAMSQNPDDQRFLGVSPRMLRISLLSDLKNSL